MNDRDTNVLSCLAVNENVTLTYTGLNYDNDGVFYVPFNMV